MKIAAVIMILLSVMIGVIPMFTDCESQGRALTLADGRQIPMKCHWTAQAETALAVPLFATGAMLTKSKKKETLRNLGILGVILGIFVILLPTALIGVCGNPDMICNSIMKPTLILTGSLVVALSLFGVVKSFQAEESLKFQEESA
jgi:hypothetical protein